MKNGMRPSAVLALATTSVFVLMGASTCEQRRRMSDAMTHHRSTDEPTPAEIGASSGREERDAEAERLSHGNTSVFDTPTSADGHGVEGTYMDGGTTRESAPFETPAPSTR